MLALHIKWYTKFRFVLTFFFFQLTSSVEQAMFFFFKIVHDMNLTGACSELD